MIIKNDAEDIRWDYKYHIDPSGRTLDEHLIDYQRTFSDLYRYPMNQSLLRPLRWIGPLTYLWNAGILKISKIEPDQFEILIRSIKFRKDIGFEEKVDTKFLLRVDDFPRFDIGIEGFLEFHDIAKKSNVDYLLGVTPFLSEKPFELSDGLPDPLNDEEVDTLMVLKKAGVEFGLHGSTHRTLYKRYHTESVGLSCDRFLHSILKAKKNLTDLGLKVDTYIPPFNTFDMSNFNCIKGHFKAITGGPEMVPTMGTRLSPCSIQKTLYIPVYGPFYEKCSNLAPSIKRIKPLLENEVRTIPLTVHWSWEVGTSFEHFRELCDLIGGRTKKWSDVMINS